MFSLTRLSGCSREVDQERMIAKECKLVEQVVSIVGMVKKGTEVGIVDQVHLGIDEIGTNQCRESHAGTGLSPGREVVEPGTHDGAGDVALRRRKEDAKHATVLDTVG
jgi:hypothetical protein